MTDDAELMTLQKMWTIFETNCAYDIWKNASKKKKHLCDKYAWWQIMQKFNGLWKKRR